MNKKISYHFFLVISLFCTFTALAQERTISGRVTDSKTGLPLVACSVFSLTNGNGVITDDSGLYTFNISAKTDTICISMVGYKNMRKAVSRESEQVINFQINAEPNSLIGVVVSGKAKLTRAQRLIKNVIKYKPVNDLYEDSSLQCHVYDKVELDAKNIPPRLQHSRILKPLAFALEHIDSTEDNQKYLPLYLSESLSDYYYQKDPFQDRSDYKSLRTSGIPNQTILTYIDGLYKGLNIYHNNIKLVKINFISPIADDALNFYKYHISDTLYFNGYRCIQVQFHPLHEGTNTFNGYLWVVDSIFAVKSIVMHMDKSANIDWVQRFEVSQYFELDSTKKFIPYKNVLYIDGTFPMMKKFGVIAKKTTVFKDVILNNPHIDTAFSKKLVDITSVKINDPDTAYWRKNRFEPLSRSENFVYDLVDTLKKIPIVVIYGKVVSALVTGYYTAGKIDVGNLYYFYTSNHVEGNRYSVGFKTNKFLTRQFQFKTHIGYSSKDDQVRYDASTLFVLSRKPWSTLLLSYSNDIQSLNDYNDELDQNSVFASFLRRIKDSAVRLVNDRTASITFNKYLNNGLAFFVDASNHHLTPYFNVYYTYGSMKPYIVGKSGPEDIYKTNEVSASVRYAYKEKFITQNYRRGSLGSNYPIFTFTYTKGLKVNNGLFTSHFDYDKFDFKMFHDFNDGRLGRLTYTLQAGTTNGVLPILLLDVQKGNDTYYYDKYAFNNMNQYEFVADKYVSLMLQQNWGGFPFRYISFLRKMKLRSLTTFNGVWGNMSAANKAANGFNDPAVDYHFTVPDKVPYMEAGVGVSNIFEILRVDALWRLTYRNNPGIPKFGIKVGLELKF